LFLIFFAFSWVRLSPISFVKIDSITKCSASVIVSYQPDSG